MRRKRWSSTKIYLIVAYVKWDLGVTKVSLELLEMVGIDKEMGQVREAMGDIRNKRKKKK